MPRLILIVVLVIVVMLWWSHRRRLRDRHSDEAAPPRQRGTLPAMVSCAHCGVHLPQADALPGADATTYYCCAEHRRSGSPTK